MEMMVKKIINVAGVKNANGSLKNFEFGFLPADEIPSDDVCLQAVRDVVPTLDNVREINWAESFDANGNKTMKALLTPKSQVKGC